MSSRETLSRKIRLGVKIPSTNHDPAPHNHPLAYTYTQIHILPPNYSDMYSWTEYLKIIPVLKGLFYPEPQEKCNPNF